MPAEHGYGYAQFEFGESVGDANSKQYTILRKLGWGMHSSTWLAREEVGKRFVAIKALTGHMTRMNEKDISWEIDALWLLSARDAAHPLSPHCVRLLDKFTVPGRGSAGSHLCFVLPVYGGDVNALLSSRTAPFELATAKRIILHLLRGIAHAHNRDVVHGDIKQDNIFFATSLEDADIERWIEEDPARRHPPETSHDGIVHVAVSQPLPMISDEVSARATYVLADFGCAVPSMLHDCETRTPVALRAPESVLGGKWDKPADIWSFGCMVYELVTARHLFVYTVNKKYSLTEDENLLYQMLLFTGESSFRADQLHACPRASEYFDASCELKKRPQVIFWPLESRIRAHFPDMPEPEVNGMAFFIRRCLCLNPDERPTAEELLQDPWLAGVDE
ncbi:kinase-like protein [Mycena belliarum]|uniref:non-specific serine/threonine protein kinase n=1 Tax=Mycena belliarum TaxID=1033014 RepID=A0AAD6XVL9_9AGAR|nr:kinase-like protein [Mycena belliae]